MTQAASSGVFDLSRPTVATEVRSVVGYALIQQSAVGLSAHLVLGALLVAAMATGTSASVSAILAGVFVASAGVPRLVAAQSFSSRLVGIESSEWRSSYRTAALVSSISLSAGTALLVPFVGFERAPWLILLALTGVSVAGLALVTTDIAILRFHGAGVSARPRVVVAPVDPLPQDLSDTMISPRPDGCRGTSVPLALPPAPPERAAPLLSELADDPDVQGILGGFLLTLGGRAAALQAALVQRDVAGMKRLAHQLKGVAGGYGYPSITEQAKVLEEALAADDEARVSGAVDALCTLCLRARSAVEGASANAG
jgi:HPt (histidine-containing phosphotransfer) domain-containing protein